MPVRHFKFIISFAFLCIVSLSLTGCLTHWFVETESRLQVENATEDYSIISVSVVSKDSSMSKTWIDEAILPGERSRVMEGDWVGDFTVRFRYTKSADATGDILEDIQEFDLDGGSLYLVVGVKSGSLTYKFR